MAAARVLALTACLLSASTVSGADDVVVIDPAVREAATRGSVRVLVELRVAGGARPEAELASTDAVARQRSAIASAQQGVVTRLAGTSSRVARLYTVLPVLVLEIGADALASLERMGDLVARVRLDAARPPARNGGT
jgi:hypothetical protein